MEVKGGLVLGAGNVHGVDCIRLTTAAAGGAQLCAASGEKGGFFGAVGRFFKKLFGAE